jgi:hypothetical protein
MSKAILEKIEEKATTTPALGAIVWWTLEGVEALQEDVVRIAESLGFPKDTCPLIEARGGLKKSLEALGLRPSPQSGKRSKKGSQAGTSDDDARLFYDRIIDDEAQIVIVINERVVDGQDVEYQEKQRITYDRKPKTLTFANGFMRAEIDGEFRKWCLTYRGNEVRIVVMRVLDIAKAIIVRDNGGVYFVPRSSFDMLDKLISFCAQVHPNAKLTKLSILDVEGERKDMQQFAHSAIKKELDDLAKDIEALQAREDKDSIRESTLKRRLEDYKMLREKARCYKDLLQIQTGEVTKGIKSLEAKVVAMLSGEDSDEDSEAESA